MTRSSYTAPTITPLVSVCVGVESGKPQTLEIFLCTWTFHSPIMSGISPNEQKGYLQSLLLKLSGLIKKIPTTLPCGSKEISIAMHFSDLTYDTTKGPYYTFNMSWEHVFQCFNDQNEHLVVREKYGLDLVQAYIVHFSNIPEIEMNDGLQLMAQQVDTFISLMETMYVFYHQLGLFYWHHNHRKGKGRKMTTWPSNAGKKPNTGKWAQGMVSVSMVGMD